MALEPITRQEKIIAGQDLTPITRMEMFLKQFGGGGSGLPTGGAAYQQLVTDGEGNAKWEDRLAYEDVEIFEWDGNTDGLVAIELAPGYVFYKISDRYVKRDNLVSYSNTTGNGLHGNGSINDTLVMGDSVWADNASSFIFVGEPTSVSGISFPESGLYVAGGSGHIDKLTVTCQKKLDEKFIPVMSVIVLNSSTSGSSKQFKITVDDSGTISATEV